MTDPQVLRYMKGVLDTMGLKATKRNLSFLAEWAGREGVPQNIDAFNRLGTTLPLGGSHGTNAPGVQSYPTEQLGIEATAKMLQQGNFAPIRAALASGDPYAHSGDPRVQEAFRAWSGGGYSFPVSGGPATPEAQAARALAFHDQMTGGPQKAGQAAGLQSQKGRQSAGSEEAALLSQQAEAARRQVNMALLDTIGRHGRDDGLTAVLALRSQAQDLERRAQTAAIQPTAQPRMQPLAKQPTGKYEPDHPFQASLVKFAPNADRHGVATSDAVVHFVERIGELYGKPLTIGTGTNHHEYARPGHVSDHWAGHAADIPATGKTLTALGRAALVAAGADPLWAAQQTGGLYRINNHQIIFATDLGPNGGGNHWDHLHVSAY